MLRLARSSTALMPPAAGTPAFLFLDDPASGSDPVRRRRIVEAVTTGGVKDVFRQVFVFAVSGALDPRQFDHRVSLESGTVKSSTLPSSDALRLKRRRERNGEHGVVDALKLARHRIPWQDAGSPQAFLRLAAESVLAVVAALLSCLAGIAYLLLFTHPHSDGNLPAFYALTGLAVSSDSGRAAMCSDGWPSRTEPIPRTAGPAPDRPFWGLSGIMISLFLVPTGRLGVPAVLLIAVGIVGAEAALTWRAMRRSE